MAKYAFSIFMIIMMVLASLVGKVSWLRTRDLDSDLAYTRYGGVYPVAHTPKWPSNVAQKTRL